MKFRIEIRLAMLALSMGLDPIALLEMPAGAFIALRRMAARSRFS